MKKYIFWSVKTPPLMIGELVREVRGTNKDGLVDIISLETDQRVTVSKKFLLTEDSLKAMIVIANNDQQIEWAQELSQYLRKLQ